LGDYEEGTWTPTVSSGVSGSVTYTIQKGRYTKIGNLVTFWFDLTWSSLSPSGQGRVGGLPFTPVSTQQQGGYGAPQFRDLSGVHSDMRIYGNSSYIGGSAEILLNKYNSSGTEENATLNSSGRITGEGRFFTNNAY
jgi:hypothetical protein